MSLREKLEQGNKKTRTPIDWGKTKKPGLNP